jgi:hypothetical protein
MSDKPKRRNVDIGGMREPKTGCEIIDCYIIDCEIIDCEKIDCEKIDCEIIDCEIIDCEIICAPPLGWNRHNGVHYRNKGRSRLSDLHI